MGSLVVSTRPDLYSVTMTKEEVVTAFADLKRHTIRFVDYQKDIALATKMSEQEREAACELAWRLKENDNWRLLNPAYRTWEECAKNEFGGAVRQEVDRWIAEHSNNRVLSKEQRPKSNLGHRALAQVPDDLKALVSEEAKRIAPINPYTGQKQERAKDIAIAAKKIANVTVTGLPPRADPRRVEETTKPQSMSDSQRAKALQAELAQIRHRGQMLNATVWESVEDELHSLRAFVSALVAGIDERLEQVTAA